MSNSKLAFSDIDDMKKMMISLGSYLPEELIVQILCKLPIESIVRFIVVCKKWCSLIKSQTFITFHLNYTNDKNNNNEKENNNCVLVHWESPGKELEERYTLHWDNQDLNQDFNDDVQLPLLPNDPSHFISLLGSCNGLLLMILKGTYFLWNPWIRKSLFLPKPISFWFEKNDYFTSDLFGFVFDSATHDYKILRICQLPNWSEDEVLAIGFQLYSLKAGCWKDITSASFDHGVVMDHYNSSVPFLNGFLHYVGLQRVSKSYEYCYFVVAFDVGMETFCKIMLPKACQEVSYRSDLSVWAYRDSSIAVFSYYSSTSQFSLWVMGEYGVENSWTNLLTVSAHPYTVPQEYGFAECKVYALAALRKNGEFVLKAAVPRDKNIKLFLYNPKTQQFRELRSWLDYNCVRIYSYAKTLVLLDMGNDANAENWCNRWSSK